MTAAAQKAVDAALARARQQGPAAAYAELMQCAEPDDDGVLALARASLALAMREPERAFKHIEQARQTDADPADIAFASGRALNNTRQYSHAAEAFGQALAQRPDWLDARLNLAHVLRADGHYKNALREFQHALGDAPQNMRALTGVASMCIQLGQLVRGQVHLEEACALQPKDPGVWMQSGQNLQALGEPEKAVAALSRCIEAAPDWADAHTALGSAHQSAGRLDAAAAAYTTALELMPGAPAATAALAGVCDLQGDSARARALLEPLVSGPTPSPVALLAWTNLRSNKEVSDRVLAQIEHAVNDPHTPPELGALLRYRIAAACVQRENHALAFDHYQAANSARGITFSTDALTAHTQATVERILAGGEVAASDNGWQPIFIVGLPRSGTSLVEQILAGHPQIVAAGEQRAFALSAMADERSQRRASHTADSLRGTADNFRRLMSAAIAPEVIAPGRFCTDKMWQNFEWLWLIRRVFPAAPIVHCRRDPLAVGWSVFENSFGAAPPPFSTRLDDIAAYIAHYTAIMAAWEEVGAPRTIHVDYADLVTQPEPAVRALLEALGLGYDPACIAVEKRRRAVLTASFDQVQRPLYTSSVDRWRQFEAQLAPFAHRLRSYGIALESASANDT
ncbi:MAG: sulfotransferase [Gammaproteobacteria bacterium]